MTHAVERNRERMVDVEKNMDNRWLLEYPADSRYDSVRYIMYPSFGAQDGS